MRIAIISDIHSNLEALKTTLSDIERRNVDKIICLGDIITKGIHAKECLALIKEKCGIAVRGNCDRHFSTEHDLVSDRFPKQEKERIRFNQSLLSKAERDYLLNLPFCVEFYMSGSLVRLFHATPDKDYIPRINLDSIQDKFTMFLPSEQTISQEIADVVIYGHIHHSYMDTLYNRTLINVGSVGNSFDAIRNPKKDGNVLETTKSNYLIIEGEYGSKEHNTDISFQFVKVAYDIEKELKHQSNNIEQDGYRYELTHGLYRNMSKINDYYTKLGIDIDTI